MSFHLHNVFECLLWQVQIIQIALHPYSHLCVTKDDSVYLHGTEWHYSVVSYPDSRVWPPDVCVTENKHHWEQKITGKWLFMETEWQRKACTLHFVPPMAALIQRNWHKQRHSKEKCNRKILILHEKAKFYSQNWQVNTENKTIICIKINTTSILLPYLHAPPKKSEFLKKVRWVFLKIEPHQVCLVKKFPRAICGCRSGETDAAEWEAIEMFTKWLWWMSKVSLDDKGRHNSISDACWRRITTIIKNEDSV